VAHQIIELLVQSPVWMRYALLTQLALTLIHDYLAHRLASLPCHSLLFSLSL
jgi:hypothetical protein